MLILFLWPFSAHYPIDFCHLIKQTIANKMVNPTISNVTLQDLLDLTNKEINSRLKDTKEEMKGATCTVVELSNYENLDSHNCGLKPINSRDNWIV
jgi:predicted class III extradiol MEMO1 family dioxygenase